MVVCVIYILYTEIGAVAFIGIGLILGQMPLQLLLTGLLSKLKSVSLFAVDYLLLPLLSD